MVFLPLIFRQITPLFRYETHGFAHVRRLKQASRTTTILRYRTSLAGIIWFKTWSFKTIQEQPSFFFSPGTSTCHLYVPCGYRLTGRFCVYVCPYVRLKSETNGEEFQQPLGADARPTLNTRPILLQFKLKSDSLDLTVLTLRVLIIGSYFPGYFCRLWIKHIYEVN